MSDIWKPTTKAIWTIKNTLEQAIQSHQKWVDYIENTPEAQRVDIEFVGNIEHHRNCIRKYQRALDALKTIQTENERLKEALQRSANLLALVPEWNKRHGQLLNEVKKVLKKRK